MRVKDYAKDAGHGCSLPDCEALTLGVRCESCARLMCMRHTFWNTAGVKAHPFCPYCVLSLNDDLFDDEDDDGDEDDGG